MSDLIRNNIDFLRFLLKSSRQQSIALLKTLTPSQVDVMREIAQNFENIPYLWEKLTSSQRFLVRAIAVRRISKRRLTSLIVKNRIKFLAVLRFIEEYLDKI